MILLPSKKAKMVFGLWSEGTSVPTVRWKIQFKFKLFLTGRPVTATSSRLDPELKLTLSTSIRSVNVT